MPTGNQHDTQGDLSTDERLRRAMANFAKNINRTTATYMEACVHCGQCAELMSCDKLEAFAKDDHAHHREAVHRLRGRFGNQTG